MFLQPFGTFLIIICNILLILLSLRILLSWFTLPPNQWQALLNRYTDPILNYFKKNFPIKFGLFDFSVMIPVVLLFTLSVIIRDFLYYFDSGTLTPLYLVIILVNMVKMFFNGAVYLLFIFAIILLVTNILTPQTYNPMVTAIKSVFDPHIIRLHRILKIRSPYSDRIYLGIAAGCIIVFGLVGNQLLFMLVNLLETLNRAMVSGGS